MIDDTLPGADLVIQGLADLAAGARTVEALLVSIAAPGLRDAGVPVPVVVPDPELQLYALLASTNSAAAHGRYNALVRRITSFRRARLCAR